MNEMDDGNVLIAPEEVRELFEEMVTLSEDHGPDVEAAVQAAADEPLDAERATRLYTRVITLLREHEAAPQSDEDRAELAEQVRMEVADAVEAALRPDPQAECKELKLTERNGLKPREVVPTPTFGGKPIQMTEGYVEVEKLRLWRGNHRLELQVAEFKERNQGREPDDEELLKIMQGTIHLPSLGKTDPFKLKPLAQSIARKGVERPPIVSYDGIPKDGNRRIAASLLVLHGKDFTGEQKERARYIRVWRVPKGTTEDQFDAIMVALNFESDYKERWPEFIKARLVVEQFDARKQEHRGRITTMDINRIKKDLQKRFALEKVGEVTRYINMVRWAEDFEAYHVTEKDEDPASVRYKADEIFQWFYELDAGKKGEKLTREQLDNDDELKTKVYDMMFSLFDSGVQVRNLHRVIADAEATRILDKAYEMIGEAPEDALDLVDEAIGLAKRKSAKRRSVGFDQFLKTVVDRLGATPPDVWGHVNPKLLIEVRRVFQAALGSIDGEVDAKRAKGKPVDE